MRTRFPALLAILLSTSGCAWIFNEDIEGDDDDDGAVEDTATITLSRSSMVLHPGETERADIETTGEFDYLRSSTTLDDIDVEIVDGRLRVSASESAPPRHGVVTVSLETDEGAGTTLATTTLQVTVIASPDGTGVTNDAELQVDARGRRADPAWGAFLDESGVWTALAFDGTGHAAYAPTGASWTIAIACVAPASVPGTDVQVLLYETDEELTTLGCDVAPVVTHLVSGTITPVTGLDVYAGKSADQNSAAYSLLADEGESALIATNIPGPGGSTGYVRQDLDVTAPMVVPIDFSSPTALVMRSVPLVGTGMTRTGRAAFRSRIATASGVPYETVAVTGRANTGDSALQFGATNASFFTVEATATDLDGNSNEIATTWTQLTGIPETFGFLLPDLTPIDLGAVVTVDTAGRPVAELTGSGPSWGVTYATSGNPTTRWHVQRLSPGTFVLPDLSAAPGWDPAWELPSGLVTWTIRTTSGPSLDRELAFTRLTSDRLHRYSQSRSWTDRTTTGSVSLP